jgi:hypothetical protein
MQCGVKFNTRLFENKALYAYAKNGEGCDSDTIKSDQLQKLELCPSPTLIFSLSSTLATSKYLFFLKKSSPFRYPQALVVVTDFLDQWRQLKLKFLVDLRLVH